MRSIVRGVVALFAAICIIDVAKAAPTIVSPADYSKVSPFSLAFKNIIEDGSLGPDGKFATKDGKIIWSNPYFGYSDYYQKDKNGNYIKDADGEKAPNPNSQRVADRILSRENSLPVTLKWGNSSGSCTIKLWRTKKDTESTPQFTVTTTDNSVKFYDLEIGRNYTWTVTDSTGKATGHFYVMNESQAPRILLNDHDPNASGSDTSNTRDIGGYRTYKGSKVIKQGRIYRTAELEWCNPLDAAGIRQELTYLKNTIGIKYDIDFRDHADMTSTAELGYAGSSSKWKWAWKNGSYLNLNESNIGAGIPRLNINKLTGTQFGSYTSLVPKKSGTTTANKNNRKNVWCAFTNVADSAKWPLVFHCSHGKDRAGTFALVLHGILDVPKEIALKDFAISWFDSPDETLNPVNMANTITNLFSYTSYSNHNDADYRFKEQCYNFLVHCGKDAGVTEANAKSKINSFITAMTEDAEEPDVNPALNTNRETDGDTFSYTTIYHRRDGGGGSLGSDNGSTLNYIYSSSTTTSTHAPKGNLNTYNTCLCFWPVDGLPYSSPVCQYKKVGKVVTFGRYSPAGVGPYNFKAYFSSEGHSVTDRTIIEHRSGVGNYENVDLYFTTYDSSNLGEGNKNASYVYKGSSAAIEVWANATMRVRDIRDMSQKRTSKAYKAYLKFPKGSCDNARFESLEIDGDGENLLGWFTGGEIGTRQYIKVVNSILQFNAHGKTSGVAGALGLEFSLGSVNTTSSAAMLKVAGTLNINAGSTITVDAGRKGAGTYKLVSAGTLNDYANLEFNYSVDNCANGYYGVVVRDGNNLNLVVQEGEPPDMNPEDVGDANEGAWGYRVRGLGALKNETAIVFTNHSKSARWTIPSSLENVQFLVVGGGGGGGADNATSSSFGGAGGGGGGVVTGNVSFKQGDIVSVYVGAGGAGGRVATHNATSITTEDCFGASQKGRESRFAVNNSDYIKAFGGGQDQGVSSSKTSQHTVAEGTPHVGGIGGSNAGSRGGYTTRQDDVILDNVGYIANLTALSNCQRYGNIGGKGTDELFYGYPSAGGGGGATTAGGDAGNNSKGWSGGDGGEGLSSDITGTLLVYGSGGGGASGQGSDGGKGGTGAGEGGDRVDAQGTSAVANQGGGGGGSSRETEKGGNGGSGIVVLRYVDPTSAPVDPENPDIKLIAEPAVIPNLVFNGNEQNGVITGEGYTLSGVTKAEAAGTYEAIATLKTGYKWLDGTTEAKTISWSIAKFTNIWTIEPSISLSSWITGATPGELNMGVAKFGTVSATMNGAAFTELPTAVGTYSIVCTVEATSNYTALSETITFEILEVSEINPTEYGTADAAASTYTWIGYTGPWMYTTNWAATVSGTYGVPNNGTYATADFPAALENAFTCTLNQSVAVNKAEFNSPNMRFVLDNALLTLKGRVDNNAACDFGDGENDNSTIELRGANAGIVSDYNYVRLNFGCRHDNISPTGTVTVRFVVPETGWESDARLKATGIDSKVVLYANSELEIDATALGVPAVGTTKTIYLASGTGDNGVYVESKTTNIVCAAGAKGSIKIESKKLVLTVEADETTEPEEPGDDNFVSPIPSIPEEWGYVKTGLGDLKNEVAIVFTNENADAMTWTVPYKLDNVQFLVVGGGGAGGGAAKRKHSNGTVYEGGGGAGGGGGGVVTGLVNFVKNQEVLIKIGKGGLGGKYTDSYADGSGAATRAAEPTIVTVGETIRCIEAGAGGSDAGHKMAGGQGASNAGSRKKTVNIEVKSDAFYVNPEFVTISKTYGHIGGVATRDDIPFSGGGGGGANGIGATAGVTGTYNAGDGGAGLISRITDENVVYGAGGGGGAGYGNGGKGGIGGGTNDSGAGNGGNPSGTASKGSDGTSAKANQGGGGGGAGNYGDGGNGGSGIVVFRYAIKPIVGGNMVNPDAVVDTARVSKPILYPAEPTIGKNAGGEPTITFAGVTVTAKKYYDISVSKNSDGTYIAKFALNESARPVVNKTALDKDDAIVVTDDAVALGVTNAKVGLYYSVEAYSDPTCAGDPIIATTPSKADKETLNLTLSKPKVEDKTLDAAFFKIVVTD